jgi:hypothetical protein
MVIPPDLPNGHTLVYRVGETEKDIGNLSSKVDRLFWAVLTLALSIAGSAVVFALTVQSIKGK